MVATIPGIASFSIVHHRRSRTPLSVPTNWSTGPKRALCRRPPAPPPGPKCHRSLKARLPSKRALIQEVRANTVRAIPACPADDPACLADVAASPARRHRRQVGSFRLGSAGSPDWSAAQRAESPALRWAATVASCVRTPAFTSRSSSEHRRTVQRAEEGWRWRRGWC